MSPISNTFQVLTRKITIARVISYTGASFSEFVIPLFLLESHQNPIHVALQWSILAFARFFSGYISSYFSFIKQDRQGIVLLDVLQGISILIPVAFKGTSPVIACYVTTVFIALFSTLQQGFITSLINAISQNELEPHPARQKLNSAIENGKNIGMLTGYAGAFFVSTKLGFSTAFVIDSASYFLSALIFLTITAPAVPINESPLAPRKSASYSLLFRPQLRFLSLSQMLLSFAVFLFNGSFIFHLKRNLEASDGVIATFFMSQYLGYTFGSTLASHIKRFPKEFHPFIRSGFALIFLGFALCETPTYFVFWNTLLSFLLGLSQPAVMVLFQEGVSSNDQRSLGAARTALVSIVGAAGAAVAGYLLKTVQGGAMLVYLGGALFSLFSALLFAIYMQTPHMMESNRASFQK